ncbi:hypothetical protein DFJ77DRAFT_76067 [Powellomyces hirtus]|nr:hypothetical protein DFJ77DRAFT_76067 [Powellomyces hirtus]
MCALQTVLQPSLGSLVYRYHFVTLVGTQSALAISTAPQRAPSKSRAKKRAGFPCNMNNNVNGRVRRNGSPDISGCKPSVEWEFKLNGDAKDSGDLKQHPAWNKKFDTACGCADAVLNAPGPAAIMFVWNSVTKGCYPKGIYRIPSGEYESATLLLPYVTADPDAAKTYTVGNSGRIAAVSTPIATRCLVGFQYWDVPSLSHFYFL